MYKIRAWFSNGTVQLFEMPTKAAFGDKYWELVADNMCKYFEVI